MQSARKFLPNADTNVDVKQLEALSLYSEFA